MTQGFFLNHLLIYVAMFFPFAQHGFLTVPKKWSGDDADDTTRPLSTAGGSQVAGVGTAEKSSEKLFRKFHQDHLKRIQCVL